jgi:hypothetical protein
VGNKPVLTFPIPGVPTATATATLDAKFMAESIVVKHGANTYEFAYSDYKDFNNPLDPADALIPGRITEKKNGTVVRNITTTLTETGQMYVVMPVPASVKAAMKPTNQPPNWILPAAPAAPQAAAATTPRLANGKPDLTGVWAAGFNPITGSGTRRCGPTQNDCNTAQDNFWVDYEWISPSRFGIWGHPIYKPEFWDKVHAPPHLSNGERRHDAVHHERHGGGNREFRSIPTDGRKHLPQKSLEATYMGYTVGHWEGDTLVLDSIAFVDSTWLGRGGLFHSPNMRIVEKFTRRGDENVYDITIEDPDVFVEPWVMATRILRPAGGDGIIPERAYCEVYEQEAIVNQLRH